MLLVGKNRACNGPGGLYFDINSDTAQQSSVDVFLDNKPMYKIEYQFLKSSLSNGKTFHAVFCPKFQSSINPADAF